MKLISCYHPTLVTNKYTGEQVLARCGKCPACLNARSASWVQRLDQEYQQHPFNFFATFQYDEQHVPQYVLLKDSDNPNYPLPSYIDSDSGVIISLKDCPDYNQADIDYCYNTKVLITHNFKDFQLFIKSLRKYVKQKFDANFRYFAAFEYGPTTFRSHIHSLFFIDSPLLAETFAGLLPKFWKYGYTFDPHLCSGSASQYVASYLNCSTSLPKIYLHPYIKQKALFSKCPPLGSYSFKLENYKELFFKEANELTLFQQNVSKFRNVPLWRFIQSRIYPRITAFDRLSHFDRMLLYRLGQQEIFYTRNYPKIIDYLQNLYWRPYFEIAFKSPNKRGIYHFNMTSLKKFVGVILRVCDNADKFGVSIDFYVTKIENFYDKKQKSDLREYFYLQDEYFKTHPVSDFLIINSNFYIQTKNKLYEDLKDWQKYYLNLYMPNRFHDGDVINYNYSDADCYRSLRAIHDKIHFDNTKRKNSNDWLEANKDKFNNIITYNEQINNYV